MSFLHPNATTSPYKPISKDALRVAQQQIDALKKTGGHDGPWQADSALMQLIPPGYRLDSKGQLAFYGDTGAGPILTYAPYALGGVAGGVALAGAAGAGAGTAGSATGLAAAPGAAGVVTPTVAGTGVGAGTGGGIVAGLSTADLLRYGLPIAGNIAGSLIQAHAATSASEAEQKYLEEALAYQKESDLYTRTTEANRYSSYQGRIAPFIATGTSSNARMAALLGLPPDVGGSNGPTASQRVPTDPATQAAIRAELRATNSSDSPAAWDEYLASHGDSSVKNWSYWKNRIDTGEGVGKGYAGPPATASAPAVTSPVNQPLVTMRSPDGTSTKAVPQNQVAHYQQLGATVVAGAA